MFTQLSLFDWSGQFDSVSPTPIVVEPTSKPAQPVRIYGEARCHDSIQPMGDLARLVIARYEMMARRREEMIRRKAENPRKSIRVLSPA